MAKMLTLKTINELCLGDDGKYFEFHIPSYQRGYRWTEQATKLLDDLFEFYSSKPTQEAIYCLQPIIVRHNAKKDTAESLCFDIIDGQQRLTTILILLNQLLRENDSRFTLSYERGDENKIDAHYKESAEKGMRDWFDEIQKENPKTRINSAIEGILLSSTNIIWYELPEDTSPEDCRKVFRNINAGKIPLTVSELTKAMLLNAKLYQNNKSEQLYKASVWDEMARTLENKLFWEFITNHSRNKMPQTKVDYLLLLDWCRANHKEAAPEQEAEVFKHFETLLIGKKENVERSVQETFESLREHFRVFQDWYDKPQYSNYIGYLVRYKNEGIKRLLEIINEYNNSDHDSFIQWLKGEIRKTIEGIDVDSLEYVQDKENYHLKDVLLVFAIETANKLGYHFDFEPAGGWSLEHVFAQQSKKIGGKDKEGQLERLEWIEKYLRSKTIEAAMRDANDDERRSALTQLTKDLQCAIDEKNLSDEVFTALFDRIGSLIEHYEINIHSINNIALIGKDDNSSLQNDPFYMKRSKIIRFYRSGIHSIPQSTLNVFQKVYSIPVDDSNDFSAYRGNLDIWSKQDGEAYLKHIKAELKYYLAEEILDNAN